MSRLILVLVFVSLGLRGMLLGFLVAKKLYRTYIFFFVYLSFSFLSSAIRLGVRNHYLAYFYAYWATEAVYTLLSVFVIIEAFSRIFKDFYPNRGFQIMLACAGMAILVFVLLTPVGRHVGVSSVTALILSANLAVGLLQMSTLLVLLGLIVFFQTKGHGYEVGIVVGYGLFASVHLTVLALRSQLGPRYQATVAYAHPIAYIGSILVWLYAFLWGKSRRAFTQQDPAIGGPGDASDDLGRLATVYRSFTRKGRVG